MPTDFFSVHEFMTPEHEYKSVVNGFESGPTANDVEQSIDVDSGITYLSDIIIRG